MIKTIDKRATVKKILIYIMLAAFIYLMVSGPASTNTLRIVHESIGIILITALILHSIWNRSWYSSIFKGTYGFYRILLTITDVLLILSCIVLILSAPMVSQYLFRFMNLHASSIGRKMHMASTIWTYLLMSFHFGMHRFKERNKLLSVCLAIAGGAAFIHLRLYERMFLINEFIYMTNEPVLVQVIEYLLIFMLFSEIGSYFSDIITGKIHKS